MNFKDFWTASCAVWLGLAGQMATAEEAPKTQSTEKPKPATISVHDDRGHQLTATLKTEITNILKETITKANGETVERTTELKTPEQKVEIDVAKGLRIRYDLTGAGSVADRVVVSGLKDTTLTRSRFSSVVIDHKISATFPEPTAAIAGLKTVAVPADVKELADFERWIALPRSSSVPIYNYKFPVATDLMQPCQNYIISYEDPYTKARHFGYPLRFNPDDQRYASIFPDATAAQLNPNDPRLGFLHDPMSQGFDLILDGAQLVDPATGEEWQLPSELASLKKEGEVLRLWFSTDAATGALLPRLGFVDAKTGKPGALQSLPQGIAERAGTVVRETRNFRVFDDQGHGVEYPEDYFADKRIGSSDTLHSFGRLSHHDAVSVFHTYKTGQYEFLGEPREIGYGASILIGPRHTLVAAKVLVTNVEFFKSERATKVLDIPLKGGKTISVRLGEDEVKVDGQALDSADLAELTSTVKGEQDATTYLMQPKSQVLCVKSFKRALFFKR